MQHVNMLLEVTGIENHQNSVSQTSSSTITFENANYTVIMTRFGEQVKESRKDYMDK